VTERKLEKTVELDATPEQVWAAIATGPGISAWFVPTQAEQRAGGAITQDFGGGAVATGRITAWEPARRFAYGAAEAPPEGTPNYAFEFLIEGRGGAGAVLKFVQSGFVDGAEGWENEYDSLDKGWDLFFGNLGSYLAHFAGQPVRSVVTMAFVPCGMAEAWTAMEKALGLTAMPAVGEQVTLDGPQRITGVVDVSTPEFLGVRSAHALHRFGAEGNEGCGISAYHYFYGEPVDTDKLTEAWQGWLTEVAPTGS
jgi:uncharacterized protein YndB with AHSA1/START domain